MGHSIGKRQGHVLDTTFHLKFVERLYDGSPRWWDNKWEQHVYTPPRKDDPLDREPGVNELIKFAANPKNFYTFPARQLITCVNPDCHLRSWRLQPIYGSDTALGPSPWFDSGGYDPATDNPSTYDERIHDMMAKMSNGQFDVPHPIVPGLPYTLSETCPNCVKPRAIFGLSDIKGKWVYVLKGTLEPFLEIFIKDLDGGSIHSQFQNGHFTDDTRPFDGTLVLDTPQGSSWHFFLSPVRLGRRALSKLSSSPFDLSKIQQCLAQNPKKWDVSVMQALQPWATTVCRKFWPPYHQKYYEFIPLVDPFSWVAQISEYDLLPILAARQRLLQDPNENAKAFIASTLAQEIGRVEIGKSSPPVYGEAKGKDRWDVRDDTVPPPHEFKASGNIALAWVNRYKAAEHYLTEETNFACSRVSYTVRFSLAHRIVEIACQEDTRNPDSLSFGLIHWAHILQPMLTSKAGETFTIWAAKNPDAAERIPQKNVLRGDGVGPGSGIAPSLPPNVFMYLIPAIVNGSHNPASDLTQHLAKFDIDAALSPSLENFLTLQGKTLEVASSYVDDYVESLPPDLDSGQLKKYSIAVSLKERLEFFSKVQHVEDFLNLYTSFTGWNEKEKNYTTGWHELGERKEKIEKAAKVGEFISGATERLVKSGMNGDILEIAEALEKPGATLGAEKLTILKASKALRAFRWAGIGEAFLAGPIGLVTGGLTLAIEVGGVVDAYRSGDPGAAVGHGVQAGAAVLVVFMATATWAAGAAAVASIAGPVGLIVAALILIGTAIMYFCAKNDLQLYADHCFLGKSYGTGGFGKNGKPWMIAATGAVIGWSGLRYYQHTEDEHPDRFKRQQMALLRIMTGFRIMNPTLAPLPLMWYICPAYVPQGAYFDVEMDLTQKGGKKETYCARVLPNADNGRGDWVWTKLKPGVVQPPGIGGGIVNMYRDSNGQIGSIGIQMGHIYGPHDAYESRVRLVYDASGKVTLPAYGWVTINSGERDKTVTSAESEGEEDGEKKEEKEIDNREFEEIPVPRKLPEPDR